MTTLAHLTRVSALRLTAFALFHLVIAFTPAASQVSVASADQRFFGKWVLNEAQSQISHTGDDYKSVQWRRYEPDGDRVKVSWGNSAGQIGTYSARCDRAIEPAASGRIRCWRTESGDIEGEQLDPSDKVHRYYRRAVSSDGKTLTIVWYTDAKRRHEIERWVYTKVDQ
jgi:hypothetical protein